MTLSSNRIIKLRHPVRKAVVLPFTEQKKNNPNKSQEHGKPSFDEKSSDQIYISQSDMQKELQYHYHKGLEEGKLVGYQQAENDFRSRFESLTSLIKNFEQEKKNFYQESEEPLVKLALKVAEKILIEVPSFVPNLIQNTVTHVLGTLSNEPVVEIQLNPGDFQNFKELKSDFEKSFPNIEKIALKSNPKITPGGCLIETDTGKIDARLETKISHLIQQLRKEFESTQNKGEAVEFEPIG